MNFRGSGSMRASVEKVLAVARGSLEGGRSSSGSAYM